MIKASEARGIAEKTKQNYQNKGDEWVKNTVSEICKRIEELNILQTAAANITAKPDITLTLKKVEGEHYEIYCNYYKFQHLCMVGKGMEEFHDQLMAALSTAFTENEYIVDLQRNTKVLEIKW